MKLRSGLLLFEHASCCAPLTYSRATADGADDAAGEGEEEVHADYDALATAKMAYRNVPSVFNTWEGKHTRFPEDEGDDDRCFTPVSEEMQAQVDAISAGVSSAMLADPVL